MTGAFPAVFLDRDGVLNSAIVIRGRPYPPRVVKDLEIPESAVTACQLLKAHGFKLVCVTNQPDVARGLMAQSELDAINRLIVDKLHLDDLRVCPHSDEDGCDCRKPKPGMILDAARALNLDIASSYMVGDRWRDVDAGLAAGCLAIFIDHNYSERRPIGMSFTCGALIDAAHFIIEHRAPLAFGAGESS